LTFVKINDIRAIRASLSGVEFKPETNFAVAMGRVSIQKNKDKGSSDEAQLERMEKYMGDKALVLAHEPWDVAETGSKHDKRRHFIEMLELVKTSQFTPKPIKHIVFSHQSRSNRNRESAREIENLIRSSDVTLHCVRDGLVLNRHSPFEDWLRWDIFNGLNEKFIVDHTKNVWDGIFKRLEMGLFPGKAPFGYKNHRSDALGGLSIFMLDSPECDWIREAFELMATDLYSITEVKAMLDAKHKDVEKSPDEKRLGESFREAFYYGEFEYMGQLWKGHPEYHPVLVPFGLWKKVQEVLENRIQPKVTERNHPYIGLIRCGGHLLDEEGLETEEVCGGSVTAEEKRKTLKDGSLKRHHYYRCASRRTKRCSQRSADYMKSRGVNAHYREEALETLMQEIVRKISFTTEQVGWMKALLLKHHHESSSTERQQRDALKTRYEMLFRYQERAYEDKLGGVITEEMFREKNGKWTSEREEVKARLDGLENNFDERIENGIACIELLKHAETTWKNATKEMKARIIKILVSNLVLVNGSLRYEMKKPFDVLVKGSSESEWWTRTGSNR